MSQCDGFFDYKYTSFLQILSSPAGYSLLPNRKMCHSVTGFSTGTMRFFTWVNIADMQLGECDSPLHLGVFFDPAVNIVAMQ